MSATLTQNRVLVLNKNWTAVGTVSLQRAIVMLFSEYADGTPKAKIIEPESYQQMTWADWSKLKAGADDEVIRTANLSVRIPEVILLSKYEKLPRPKLHFSRRTLYKRDNYTCQYCYKRFGSEELTIDHVLPRAQGGVTSWENCSLACVNCNAKKANRTPKQAGMKLLTKPVKPKMNVFKADMVKPIKSWQAFIDTAYWNVELQNENIPDYFDE
jgi:5-methylcytosine-specific restriction endonuclease McrA